MEEVLLSIVCIAYNQEPYIKNSLEGILRQNVNFRYEIIIHDDASTDGTTQIIEEYEKKYPNIIRVIYQESNQYTKKEILMLKDVYSECRGKYIALCEGDDCWIDNNKLQIQIDYLERHRECVLTVHNALRLECDNGNMQPMGEYDTEKDISEHEVIVHNERIATASFVFNSKVIPKEDFFWNAGVGDYMILLSCIMNGKVHYIDRIMSVYRYKSVGSWSNNMLKKKKERIILCIRMIHLLKQYNIYSDKKMELYIIDKIQMFADCIINLLSEKNIEDLFNRATEEINEKFEGRYNKYLPELASLFRQTNDLEYCSDMVRAFAQEYKHIVIMGTGKYAGIVSRQLMNNDIAFEGFVVSPGKKICDTYMKKSVWELQELPFSKNDTGIIVGINPNIWSEISSVLNQIGIENYICPFLLNVEI